MVNNLIKRKTQLINFIDLILYNYELSIFLTIFKKLKIKIIDFSETYI